MSQSGFLGLTASVMLATVMCAGAASATSFQTVYTFAGNDDGAWPAGNLVADKNGNFYGTTSTGGPNGAGTVFRLAPDGTETEIYHFTGGTDGNTPLSGLLADSDGNFYGVTEIGGVNGIGNVFKITPDGILSVIYSFGTKANDGGNPVCTLAWTKDHELIGTTINAGTSHDGTVFKVSLKGKETILHAFSGPDGMYPRSGLVSDKDGNFYGVAYNSTGGATAGNGTAYKITADGTFTKIYTFLGKSGIFPYGGLAMGKDGNLYGTTNAGGTNNDGTVFKLTTSGQLTVLHAFTGAKDGDAPAAKLFVTSTGDVFGTTTDGGKHGYGTVFKVSASGNFTTLHAFTGGADGSRPQGILTTDAPLGTSLLYGTTYAGGVGGNGVIYTVKR